MILIEDLMVGYTTSSSSSSSSCGDDIINDHPLLLVPEDVLIRILVCLPVKSLLRFKSVSKSWRQLIQTPFFIDLHTTFNTTCSKFGNPNTNFILETIEPSSVNYEHDIKLFMLSSSSGSGDGDGDGGGGGGDEEEDDDTEEDDQKKKMVFKLDEDLGFSAIYKDYLLHDTLRMVGSCNGIICLHDPNVMEQDRGCTRQHYSNIRDVCLWNPATRQFRILPKMITTIPEEEYGGYDFVVFGFDVKNNDYKVVRITSFIQDWSTVEGCMCSHVQVYSLSTDSWRLLEGINSLPAIPSQSHFGNHGIYLNGSYFFVGKKFITPQVYHWMMLSFNFTKEIFTIMQLPEHDNSHDRILSYLGDKMAAVFTTPRIDSDGDYWYYDIWVLNEQHCSSSSVIEYKKEESWTKLHSLRIKTQRGQLYYSQVAQTRYISNNGEFALISTRTMNEDGYWRNKLQLFNLITKEAKKDFLIGTTRANVYKESLVSIMGAGNVLLRWQLPTHGTTYKLNLHAPFISYYFTFGIGLCLTSDTGGCIGVRSLRAYDVRDATPGEAKAMLEAIKWAIELELSPIIIESDSKNVVSFFMEDDDDGNNSTYWSSEALSLLRKAKLILNSSEIGTISLKYCSRSSNYVADIAAKLGREGLTWSCKDWTANFPGEMVMCLSKDLGLETR